jgi:cell wall-associated NlpC family hydrolase
MNMLDSARHSSQLPSLDPLDPRLNAIRADLADMRLYGKLDTRKFVEGAEGLVCQPVADLKETADKNSTTQHQLLMGEEVLIFETSQEFCWVQSKRDGYMGYANAHTIERPGAGPAPASATHIVSAPVTFCYPYAELRSPPDWSLSMGSRVTINAYETLRGTRYGMLAGGGAIIEKHLRECDDHDNDFVKICELMLHTPYLWGGSSGFGIDCSALVQLSMRMCGREILRDTDMQAATLGEEIDPGKELQGLRRGDLIFWRGHVAICWGDIHKIPHIIHASGHTMDVAIEPMQDAIDRISYLYEQPIGFRRP